MINGPLRISHNAPYIPILALIYQLCRLQINSVENLVKMAHNQGALWQGCLI